MFTYLTMTKGHRAGTNFPLESDSAWIGRGTDCEIVLTDPLASRMHARVFLQDDAWWLRDENSRNGTFVNGQKIDEARIDEGSQIRIGSVLFEVHTSVDHPPANTTNVTQTILHNAPIVKEDEADQDFVVAVGALREEARARDFLMLYQLSIRLNRHLEPDDVIRIALELLHARVSASMTGFLGISDDGQLKAERVIPESASKGAPLSETLTDLVLRKGHAVWIDNQVAGGAPDSHFADAICVPLIDGEKTLGAVHTYLEKGRFNDSDFEMAVSLSRVLGVALARARSDKRLESDYKRLVDKTGESDRLIGESTPMLELQKKISRVAKATGCVLIRGESGAGKELVARAIHRHSARNDRPMLTVNCAAIPRDLMESQLFGHKRGAFTGADTDHTGWFQQADSGTLFLDEVGEMTLEGQAKLLRILEGHPFLPVGGTAEVNVDVRVIAATNRDLREFVAEGKFREDLYYRLSVFELYLPALRDRGTDIELLMTHFLDHFKEQHGRPNLQLADEARTKLLSYGWPGNVRQIRNVIDSAVVMADGECIEATDLGLHDAGVSQDSYESLRVDYWEEKLIREALSRTDNSIPAAAKMLGIGRATLYRKVDDYGIER